MKTKTIEMVSQRFEKKAGTKTVFNIIECKTELITDEVYFNIFDACKYFRRLGGSEIVTKSYTKNGYKATKLVSISPCKEFKTVREFKFL